MRQMIGHMDPLLWELCNDEVRRLGAGAWGTRRQWGWYKGCYLLEVVQQHPLLA